jgi:hypothetical protein
VHNELRCREHSLRKSSSSYALDQVNGPTHVSVYLCMGQSLGKLKDRYIHFGEGPDQLCGRMIAGLPFNSECVGVLLPDHYHDDDRVLGRHIERIFKLSSWGSISFSLSVGARHSPRAVLVRYTIH